MHESTRQSTENCIADIYDAPRWRKVVGEPTLGIGRIGLEYCVDGTPIFRRKHLKSIKIAQFSIYSLPPWLRCKAEYMLVQMLVPSKLKGQAAKKYYDFAGREMNKLRRDGVDGVKVEVFGVSLDAPGRREMLNFQAVNSYYPCPHCLYSPQPGLRKPTLGGYRRFLPISSPWRAKCFEYKGHRYEFRDEERRGPPRVRTDEMAHIMSTMAQASTPVMGHKGKSFLSNWHGLDWDSSMCDVMHDLKCVTDMMLKALVGHAKEGMYKAWTKKKDDEHRHDCSVYEIFPDFVHGAPPPWRLSKADVELCDKRVQSMWSPAGVDKLSRDGHSFWTFPDVMWKCKNKHNILLVLLPTCLRGLVPAAHQAILTICNALVHLRGAVLCALELISRGVRPGSKVIEKLKIQMWGKMLIRGLVLLEGSFPVAHLNPNLHHLVHYGQQTAKAGLLGWVAMWSFERVNKRVKTFVRSVGKPVSALAKALDLDMATRVAAIEKANFDEPAYVKPSKVSSSYSLSKRERFDLAMCGVTSFDHVRASKIIHVSGVHFKAGGWGNKRCGSVVTTIYGGRSRYCHVLTFLNVQAKWYARVQWLSVPEYPYTPNLLVVRVKELTREDQLEYRSLISVDVIEPCSVAVMPDSDEVHYFMLRSAGYDRVRVHH